MSARNTLVKAHNDLTWAVRQLRNPDEVKADSLQSVIDTLNETVEALEDIADVDLPAERAAASLEAG